MRDREVTPGGRKRSLEAILKENDDLRACVRDLVALSSLSALWGGRGPPELARPVLALVQHALHLDLAYVRLVDATGGRPVEAGWAGGRWRTDGEAREIGEAIAAWLACDTPDAPLVGPGLSASGALRLARIPVGLGEELGVLVAGSERPGFPAQLDRARLDMAANQVAVVLQAARLSREQAARAEAEVARARLEAVVRQMPVGVIIAEAPSGRLLLGNDRVDEIWRHPLGAAASVEEYRPYLGFHPDGRPYEPAEWPLACSITTGEVVVGEEIDFLRGDGSSGTMRVSSTPIRDDTGRIIAGVVAFDDVTERKRVEAAVRQLAAIVESSDDAVIGCTLDGTLESWNAGAEQTYGYGAPEVVGRSLAIIIPPDRSDELWTNLERLRRGERIDHHETIRVRKDGARIHVSLTMSPIRDGAGRIVGASGIGRDISERKRAQEVQRFLTDASTQLMTSLDYEATLASLARLVVPTVADWCVVDLLEDERILRRVAVAHADPARSALARELLRYPPDLDKPDPASNVLRTGKTELEDQVPDAFAETIARDEAHLALLRQIGMRSHVAVPLVARGRTLGTILLGHAESGRRFGQADVELAEELARRAAVAVDNARLYQEAQSAIAARDDFLSRASHELRTPLTSALGTVRLLDKALAGTFRESPGALLELANRNLGIMAALVNDLLDASKLAAGRETLALESVDLAEVVRTSLEVVGPQASEKGITLRAPVPPRLRLAADRLKLEQVLVNLLANAVKFTPGGGDVSVEAEAERDGVLIRVRDTGQGIAAEHLEAIFEPFFQVRTLQATRAGERRVQRVRGTGLGLAICRQIVALHGGRIWAESEGLGRGSTFVMRLPTAQARPRAA